MSLRISSHARQNTIVHQLNVPRALVHAVMEDVDLNCLEYRTIRKKAKKKKKVLHLKGPTGWFPLLVMIRTGAFRIEPF